MVNEEKYKITSYKVKQYNSTWKWVTLVNGKPIAISSSRKQESDIKCYLMGYNVTISDGRLKRELDKIKNKGDFDES